MWKCGELSWKNEKPRKTKNNKSTQPYVLVQLALVYQIVGGGGERSFSVTSDNKISWSDPALYLLKV